MKLADHTILVNGGAAGIGRGVVMALAKEGARVAFFDSSEEKGRITEKEVSERAECMFVKVNLLDKDEVAQGFKQVIGRFKTLHGLVNCAQASRNVPFLDTTEEELRLALHTGFLPAFHLMKWSYPYLKETQGSIVNFASGAALEGMPTQTSYAAAKEALRGISRVAAKEWGPDQINVNIVCPIAASEGVLEWKVKMPEAYEKMVNNIPLRRLGDCEHDVGRVVCFLLSRDAKFITGQTIMVDGGTMMLR
ncbi:oxidoreductase [Paenibacillus sp. SSG-1]|uniref:SDR family NAD(P)-dependent oxidoreductase n=1 Tax=Paenibacillus sp. SSG-1 TaxID=1443669 RepID=UPI000B7F22E8|nr:SDR family oxidoreductase [Paenibacillus sp. SSG-1]OXL85047.1 oxidoreductase [Paenibacillus sp. SSG-1]